LDVANRTIRRAIDSLVKSNLVLHVEAEDTHSHAGVRNLVPLDKDGKQILPSNNPVERTPRPKPVPPMKKGEAPIVPATAPVVQDRDDAERVKAAEERFARNKARAAKEGKSMARVHKHADWLFTKVVGRDKKKNKDSACIPSWMAPHYLRWLALGGVSTRDGDTIGLGDVFKMEDFVAQMKNSGLGVVKVVEQKSARKSLRIHKSAKGSSGTKKVEMLVPVFPKGRQTLTFPDEVTEGQARILLRVAYKTRVEAEARATKRVFGEPAVSKLVGLPPLVADLVLDGPEKIDEQVKNLVEAKMLFEVEQPVKDSNRTRTVYSTKN
jgi:hypothetical protein